MDYGSGPYTVVIPAGMTNATFEIPITDDMILENNEDFVITINGTALPPGVTPTDPDEATVTIMDNDRKL